MSPRRSVAEHQAAVSALLTALSSRVELVALRNAVGRCLAENLVSPIPLPVFDNSQMDGYAVRSVDLAGASPDRPVRLVVGEAVPAGPTATPALPSGAAVPIMTGAPIPEGADSVVPIEVALPPRFDLSPGGLVGFAAPAEPGAFVRHGGCDVAVGDPLAFAGETLHARRLGLLAAAGIATVPVRSRPRLLLLSTGSELREPGEPLAPGEIYDANTTMLAAALTEIGVDVETARVPDRPDKFVAALRARLGDTADPIDLVVTSGGVSAGAFEVVKDALGGTRSKTTALSAAKKGSSVTPSDKVDVEFGTVAMQPGGPQGLGWVFGVPLLAFPGNPVSAWISFEVFLRPALRRVIGCRETERPTVRARLAEAVTSPPNKHQVRRGTLRTTPDGPIVELTTGPGSHLVGALAHSNALVHLPVGVAELPAGAKVMTWRLEEEAQPEPVNEGDSAQFGGAASLDNLTHLDGQGAAHMVDVAAKPATRREATAKATVRTTAEVVAKLKIADLKKGDALGVARIAGIMAAKRTSDLVPLCHPLPLTSVSVDLLPHEDSVEISATVGTTAVTGVEMEALTAASIASLTLYDMIKALDPSATIEQVAVVRKIGGKTGEWVRGGQ